MRSPFVSDDSVAWAAQVLSASALSPAPTAEQPQVHRTVVTTGRLRRDGSASI